MAGLPAEVITKAEEKARKFEEETPLLSGNYLCGATLLLSSHAYRRLASSDRLAAQVMSANRAQRLLYLQDIVRRRLKPAT